MATKQKKPKQKPQEKTKPTGPKVRKRNQVRKGTHGGMQLVLAEDVPNLGKQGDLVEVKHGYGRNYLLPNGLATVPTEHNLRLLERYKERVQQARESKIADLKVMAEQIQRVAVTVEAAANEEGHLYGSVGPKEISKALKAKNLNVEPEMVKLEGAITQADAVYAVQIQLGFDIETEVKVAVVREQAAKK